MAGMKGPTIDPRRVKVVYAGRIITGFAKETFIQVAPQGEGIQLTKGAFDKSVWTIDPDSSVLITLTLLQSDDDNDFLSERHRRQKAGLEGSSGFMVKDLRGTSIIHSNDAMVQNFAELGYGNEAQSNAWAIMLASVPTFNVGGNLVA